MNALYTHKLLLERFFFFSFIYFFWRKDLLSLKGVYVDFIGAMKHIIDFCIVLMHLLISFN